MVDCAAMYIIPVFYRKNTFLKKIPHLSSARNSKCIANPIHKVLKERIGDIDF